MEYPFVLGTAGHIDHGKTTLVKALTGVDCDRLIEEKRRGITIELGFAPLTIGDRVVSVVDVPGHEKFIRQMVAGAAGVDAVMMVVAVDEGVMPQTREHLEILELLGVRRGIVVMTKVDAVDPEILALAEEEVREAFRGTFLEGSPLVRTSAVTGVGLEELKEAIGRLVEASPVRSRDGELFLPIDRAFSVPGFGTVVTGTIYNGSIREGDEVTVVPSGLSSKVRSVQVHGQKVREAVAGQRSAVNIPGVGVDQLQRGDVLTAKGSCMPTQRLGVWLKVLGSAVEPVRHWQRLRLHLGTAEVMARVALLNGTSLEPSSEGPALLILEEPVAAMGSQRFIVRFYSPLRTIGGGEVILPYAEGVKSRSRREAMSNLLTGLKNAASPVEKVCRYLEYRHVASPSEIKRNLSLASLDRVVWEGASAGLWVFVGSHGGGYVLEARKDAEISRLMTETLERFHAANPLEKGMPMDELGRSMGLDQKILRVWLESKREQGMVVLEDGRVSHPSFVRDVGAVAEALERLKCFLDERGYMLPDLVEIKKHLAVDDSAFKRIISLARDEGVGVILPGELFFSSKLQRSLWETLAQMEEITVASVRDKLGLSRKYVMPMLEHMDSIGVTRRVQDKRVLLKRPAG
ncbi:MAG: selenocysteine-specific translation elongation factor [Thermanaerothrix sp.]|nr:selenocysteine-specific translation elongation factor [Thermanaerothrix sp.]